MARPTITAGEYYHVYNRGVEKRRIFMDGKDRVRFIHDLYEFNDRNAAPNMDDRYGNAPRILLDKRPDERELLVDLIAHAMMPNHYHLLVRSRTDDGVSLFIQKLGVGYTNYFNLRYKRSGVLFQGKYKAKHITEDRYLRHLLLYIHANPLDLFANRSKGRAASRSAFTRFKQYRWSSYRDYIGEKNFPSLLNLKLAKDLGLQRGKKHQDALRAWAAERLSREASIEQFVFEEN